MDLRQIVSDGVTFLYTYALIGGVYCALPLGLVAWFFKRYFAEWWRLNRPR